MRAPDDRGDLALGDLGDIACCLAFAVVSVIATLELAGIACFAWRCLGMLLSPLAG